MSKFLYWNTVAFLCGFVVAGFCLTGCVSIREHRKVTLEMVDTITAQQRTIDLLSRRVTDFGRLLSEEIDKLRTRVMVQEKVFSDSIASLDINKADKTKKK